MVIELLCCLPSFKTVSVVEAGQFVLGHLQDGGPDGQPVEAWLAWILGYKTNAVQLPSHSNSSPAS